MTEHDYPPSAAFLDTVRDFLTLQAHFSRNFNLLPSHWLTLYSALASVRYEHGQWICNEFSTGEIARNALISRETVRRSMQWLVGKRLIVRTNRRFALTPLTLSEIRGVLDGPSTAHWRGNGVHDARKTKAIDSRIHRAMGAPEI